MSKIRPIVLCLFEHGNRCLLQEFRNEQDQNFYFRPPGGGIEFGERAFDAMRREMREELNAEIADLEFLEVVENFFHPGGDSPKHEIAFIFKARFVDPGIYHQNEIQINDCSLNTRVVWVPTQKILNNEIVFYPEGLLKNLQPASYPISGG